MISEPASRISACSSPTALVSASSERKELEQTSSARPSVLCASVPRNGPHFVQHDRHAGLRRLPGGFGAGEAAADDVDGIFAHERRNKSLAGAKCNCRMRRRTGAREACQKTTPAGGGGPAGVVLAGRSSGGGEDRPYSSLPGRRSALTKFLSPDEGGETLGSNNARRGRRCGGRRFAGQPSGGGEG